MVGSLTVLSVSMQAKVPGDVPVETVRVARGGFPEGESGDPGQGRVS